jgi:uncharacterized protein HemX
MNFMEKIAKLADGKPEWDGQKLEPEPLEPNLFETLRDYRLSVHAWSDAEFTRSRRAFAYSSRRFAWRLAAGWALSCVLVAGSVSAGIWDHHRREAQATAAREALHEREVIEQRQQKQRQQAVSALQSMQTQQKQQVRSSDEELMASVDSDVSRQVPTAMEPLAQLMVDDGR